MYMYHVYPPSQKYIYAMDTHTHHVCVYTNYMCHLHIPTFTHSTHMYIYLVYSTHTTRVHMYMHAIHPCTCTMYTIHTHHIDTHNYTKNVQIPCAFYTSMLHICIRITCTLSHRLTHHIHQHTETQNTQCDYTSSRRGSSGPAEPVEVISLEGL